MINNPVYVKKGGGAVDTLAWDSGGNQPVKGDVIIKYKGKGLNASDFPVAYHGGKVTLLHSFQSIKIEGNVLYLGY